MTMLVGHEHAVKMVLGAALSGGSSSFTPTTPHYTPAPANVSDIRQYGAYTVTLYYYSGNLIGTAQTALNIAPNVSAAAGAAGVIPPKNRCDQKQNFLVEGVLRNEEVKIHGQPDHGRAQARGVGVWRFRTCAGN
jgi:hypothetical protein